jgi:hypothetical protein
MDDDDLLSDWVEGLAERKERLAENLYDLVYGPGQWEFMKADGDDEYVAASMENYRKDAWDIMLANPHLMDLEMRTNLAHLGLLKEED